MKINGYIPPISSSAKCYMDAARKMDQRDMALFSADRVELSHSKRLFSEAVAAAKKEAEVRVGLVTEIKEQVKNGTYQVDSRKIAEGILANLRYSGR